MQNLTENTTLSDDAVLEAALRDLTGEAVSDDDLPLEAVGEVADLFGEDDVNEAASAEIEAAVGDLERQEATEAVYAAQGEPEAPAASDKPAKVKKEKKAKVKKETKPAEPKPPKEPRLTYVTHSKSQVLAHKMGTQAADCLVLETADAMLDQEAREAKMKEVLAAIDACSQKKVQEKSVMLFTWVKNGGKLNEVMARAFKVLAKDGEITTGDKGNLQQDLLAKPYSLGTARAQAGQILTLFPMLKIATREKGKLVANPDSLLLQKARAEFGI